MMPKLNEPVKLKDHVSMIKAYCQRKSFRGKMFMPHRHTRFVAFSLKSRK
jgi:hypothetical protein